MKSVKSTITKLSLVVVAMYGFSYALVPIYDTFCEITGLNGKTNEVAYTGSDIEKEKERIAQEKQKKLLNTLAWLILLKISSSAGVLIFFYAQ